MAQKFLNGIASTGNVLPSVDSTYDLGHNSYRWANLYVDAIGTTSTFVSGGTIALQSNISTLNKAETAYVSFATRNTSGSETLMDLSNVGTINGVILANQTDFVSAANGGTFGGNLTIKHPSSPTLTLTDDSPDPDNIGKIDVANNYMTFALDSADGIDSSRIRFQIDGANIVEILPNTTYFRQTNLHLQKTSVSNLNFRIDAAITSGVDLGKINFGATNDEGTTYVNGGNIIYEGDGTWDLSSVNNGPTRMKIQLRNSSGALSNAMMLSSNLNANFYADGTFAGSVTATSLDINGDADISGNITNAGWTGDVIASAYLDADTMHLTGAQTISGTKTFSDASNRFNGHLFYDAYDAAGNHYPHFQDGSSNSGTTVNWRQYYGSNQKTHTWTSDALGNMLFTYQGGITATGALTGASLDINGDADISGNLSGVDTLTATTLSVTNYGLASGDIPNNAADTTGNASTVTTNANLTGHITSNGNAAVLGAFTTAQLSAALSDSGITTNPTINTIPLRNSNGDIAAREIILSSGLSAQIPTVLVSMYPSTNQLVRTTPAAVAASLPGAFNSSSVTSATTTTTVVNVAHASYTAAFFDFVIKNGTNVRAGTVYACHNGASTPLVEFTETSTVDLGDTSDVTLSVDISGTNMRLRATTTSSTWTIKSLTRLI